MQGPDEHKLRAEVARTLRELREAKALTQAELAGRLGVQQSFVSKYEAAERKLDIVDVRAICAVLEASFVGLAVDLERRWSEVE